MRKLFPHSGSTKDPTRTSSHGARSLLNLEFSKISDNSNFQCEKNRSAKILADNFRCIWWQSLWSFIQSEEFPPNSHICKFIVNLIKCENCYIQTTRYYVSWDVQPKNSLDIHWINSIFFRTSRPSLTSRNILISYVLIYYPLRMLWELENIFRIRPSKLP